MMAADDSVDHKSSRGQGPDDVLAIDDRQSAAAHN
jgi:hypothetical protein